MKKVLHVVVSIDPKAGGVSQAVRSIINSLNAYSIISSVACIDKEIKIGSDSFTVFAFDGGRGPWNYNAEFSKWLKLNSGFYDIVIIHGLWQYHSYAAFKAVMATGNTSTKLYVMPHGMLDPYFQKAQGRKLKAIRNWFFWKYIESNIINGANKILFTCEQEKLLARQTFTNYHPIHESVVSLPVDSPPVFAEEMQAKFLSKIGKQVSNYLLFISRLDEKKGVDLLIRAYNSLKKEGLILPPLVIAGPGLDTDYGKKIIAIANNDNQIHFVGMLVDDEKWGAFYGCSAFILPSHQENFGIAVVEALACRKPVLITNQINIWQTISDCGAGLAVKDEQSAITQMIRCWLDLPVIKKQDMADNAYACYKSNYTPRSAGKKLLDSF